MRVINRAASWWSERPLLDKSGVVFAALTFFAMLWVGNLSPEPMIGDEVTHYYMLVNQAKELPHSTYFSVIPTAYEQSNEVRYYAHTNLWHYLGALVYSAFGGSTFFIQLYQLLYWLQVVVVMCLLTRETCKNPTYNIVLVFCASLPLMLLFSVALYQDIPSAAQALTAFYFLRKSYPGVERKHWSEIKTSFRFMVRINTIQQMTRSYHIKMSFRVMQYSS